MEIIKKYVKSILIPVLVGILISLITSDYMDYSMLIRPVFAPPSIVFPIVWTILYVLMGVSYGILKEKGLVDLDIKTIYYLQLFVNALWSIIFFVLKYRLFAFIWIILLAILIVVMIYRFYNKNKLAGILQIPYLIWVIFASVLNLSIYLLNR